MLLIEKALARHKKISQKRYVGFALRILENLNHSSSVSTECYQKSFIIPVVEHMGHFLSTRFSKNNLIKRDILLSTKFEKVLPRLKRIQKIYESRDTPPEFC